MKKTIVHIIQNLGRGGAETLLVSTIRELKEYNNVVVTFSPENHFGDELRCDQYYCLNVQSLFLLPFAAIKFRRILKKVGADMVHSHLLWPTVVARLGTPKKIPLLTTIHAFIANSVEYRHRHIRFIDTITYRIRESIIIAVARGALKEYIDFLNNKSYRAYALYNFVDIKKFNRENIIPVQNDGSIVRLITVGALREQKNHQYLIKAFEQLKGKGFQLDVFGTGPLYEKLQAAITGTGVNIHLKGEEKNIGQVIPQYDIFVMSSTFEGFSLSVLEAMALEMPLLLPDIASFREQCEDTAMYFKLNDTNDFTEKLQQMAADKKQLTAIGQKAKQRVIQNFTLEHYMAGLRQIYNEAFSL